MMSRPPPDAPNFPSGREELPWLTTAIGDHCTRAGAETLARRIQIYWHSRGFETVRLELVDDGTVIGIRGNLIAGLPPSRVMSAVRRSRRPPPAIAAEIDDRGLARAPAWLSNLTSSLARLS